MATLGLRDRFRAYALDGAVQYFHPHSGTQVRIAGPHTRHVRKATPRVLLFGITNTGETRTWMRSMPKASSWRAISGERIRDRRRARKPRKLPGRRPRRCRTRYDGRGRFFTTRRRRTDTITTMRSVELPTVEPGYVLSAMEKVADELGLSLWLSISDPEPTRAMLARLRADLGPR